MATQVSNQSDIQITVHWLESSRAQRLLVLLEELKLDYKIETYRRDKDGLAPEELKNIHPLGKSPSLEIAIPGHTPFVLAESGAIFEYLCENFGQRFIPARTAPELDGVAGIEAEGFRRNRYFMHYAEGSLMSLLGIAAVIRNIKNAPVPFFIKPITGMITNRINESFLDPSFQTHFNFLEGQLKTAPGGGPYLCGNDVTEADFLMIFPIEACKSWAGLTPEKFPKLCSYLDMMKQRQSYKIAEKKVIEIEGSFKPTF